MIKKSSVEVQPPVTPDASDQSSDPRRMLTLKQVLDVVPLSRATLWRMERKGSFPRSKYVTEGRRLWFADEITEWQKTLDDKQRRRGVSGRFKTR